VAWCIPELTPGRIRSNGICARLSSTRHWLIVLGTAAVTLPTGYEVANFEGNDFERR
jgi:hypothetical protein